MSKRSFTLSFLPLAVLLALAACSSAPAEPDASTHWTGEVPPCTPVADSLVDPCEPGTSLLGSVTAQSGGTRAGGASRIFAPRGLDVRYQLARSTTLIAHLVVRGTYLPGTIRCTAADGLRPPPQWQTSLPLNEIGTITCYANVRMNEYIVGSGPFIVTVIAYREVYGHNYYGSLDPDKGNETEQEYIERIRLFHEQRLGGGHDNIAGREAMLFLGPSIDIAIEAWQVMRQWRLEQQDDGAVFTVHPQRDDWLELRPDDFQQYRSQLEMGLTAFKQTMVDAHEARVAANGGRTRPEPDYPMLVSDANQLSAYFREVGAYAHPDGSPAQPPPVPACADRDGGDEPQHEPGAGERLLQPACSEGHAAGDSGIELERGHGHHRLGRRHDERDAKPGDEGGAVGREPEREHPVRAGEAA